MKIKTPHYYENFKCIASACSDSCCAGWEVDLDDESYSRYEKVEGSFGDRLRSEMSQVGEKHFTIHNKRCPFLNCENLCDIYTEMGEEALCETCTNFPRCYEEYGSTREMALSMACPEVVRLMLESNEHIHFNISEDGKPVSRYNDIHGDLYIALSRARATLYHILKRTDCSVGMKLAVILYFGDEIEKSMPKENCGRIEKCVAEYEDDIKLKSKFKAAEKHKESIATGNGQAMLKAYLNLIRECEHVSDKWQAMLDMAEALLDCDGFYNVSEAFDNIMQNRAGEYEYFLENLSYRYALRGVFDGHFADKTRFLGFMYILLRLLNMAWFYDKKEFDIKNQMFIMQTLSKEIEHSDENMALLWEKCQKGEGDFSTERIFSLIW